jgi:hypothetical protein
MTYTSEQNLSFMQTSINIPDQYNAAIAEAAKVYGISRAIQAMTQSKNYRQEANEVMGSLNSDLPEEKNQWWSKRVIHVQN